MEKCILKSWKSIGKLLALPVILSFSLSSWADLSCSTVFETHSSTRNKKNELAQKFATLSAEKKQQLQKQLAQQLMGYILSISKVSPLELIRKKSISPDQIFDLAEVKTTSHESDLLLLLAQKVETNSLDAFLGVIVDQTITQAAQHPKYKDQVAGMTPQKKILALAMLSEVVKSTVRLRGLTSDSNVKYMEWAEYSKKLEAVIDGITGKTTEEKLLKAAETKVVRSEEVRILVDGKDSFPLRDKLMTHAEESIDIMSWAIYDDKTGVWATDLLIQKYRQGVQVRVIVDRQVSHRPGYGSEIARLEAAGVPVLRWFNPRRPYEGQHRKAIIIDSEHVIAGGLNFGDVYSHKNPQSAQWRDTDIYFRGGTAVQETLNLFNRVWDSQIDAQNLKLQKSSVRLPKSFKESDSDVRMMIIDSRPSDNQVGSPILKTMLVAIREAKTSIEIENAYVVMFPAIKKEIAAAVARGVEVRILTNSPKSVDEPIVSLPILRSIKSLAQAGVRVFLKRGDTLHSKIMVVDGWISMIKSYNIHPRSERIEEEMAILILDKRVGNQVSGIFAQDLKNMADEIPTGQEIEIPADPMSVFGLRIFFDQL